MWWLYIYTVKQYLFLNKSSKVTFETKEDVGFPNKSSDNRSLLQCLKPCYAFVKSHYYSVQYDTYL